jgi:hypothetical protein
MIAGLYIRRVERAICEKGFAGGLFELNLMIPKKLVDGVALFEGDEENFALT